MSYQMLFDFLSREEQAILERIVYSDLEWSCGVQDVGKVTPVALKAKIPCQTDETCLNVIKRAAKAVDGSLESGFDWYFLKYPVGSCLPLHKDDAVFGSEHWRLNAMIRNDWSVPFSLGERHFHIYDRDAVIFRADHITHGFSTVKQERIVFSVGFLK